MKVSLVVSIRALLAVALCCATTAAQAQQQVRVDIINNGPSNGVAITPVWVGFHDGSFDSYNGGLSSQEGLERLAEDGNTTPLSDDFNAGLTYVDNSGGTAVSATVASSQAGSERVDGTLGSPTGPPPILPGQSVSGLFDIATDGSNEFFSYASMVLPSNDYYVANGNPIFQSLASLYDGSGFVEFQIGLPGTVNDAGTEVNDFGTSAANGLFPGRGLGSGQGGPNTGADENGVNTNVANAFAGFANSAGTDLAGFDFNDTNLYSNGVATIRITAVPEPSSLTLALFGMVGMAVRRRR